ncbi:MAG: prolipoprotein diacylglyceryl transferase [Chloroflexi bacterium]|nr:prolipoprotein diacylglyceryl transferase [Chloroflexota bacterium]
MNGIVISIDPVLLQLGHFELRWYSLFVVLAFIAATVVGLKRCKKIGMSADQVYTLVMVVALGGILGARLFHVLDHLGYYAQNPGAILRFDGLAIWGGLVGGGVATLVYARLAKLPFLPLADAVVPALLVAQIVGRFACIVNGDAYGGPTTLPWGFIYVNPGAMIPDYLKGIPTHPYVVYEQIWNGMILITALALGRRLKTPGALFLIYVTAYGAGRLLLTAVRQETVLFWGLQEAQVVALALLAVSVPLLVRLLNKERTLRLAGKPGA